MSEEVETFDEKCANYTVDDCITDDGQVDIDVVAGVFYSRSKSLFRDVFEEVLGVQRQHMVNSGIPEEQVEKCRIKLSMKQRKEVPEGERCEGHTKKTGASCRNRRKEGREYCGVHLRGRRTGTSYEDRMKGTYTIQEETSSAGALSSEALSCEASSADSSSRHSSSTNSSSSKPTYALKEEVIEKLKEVELNDNMYLRKGNRLYHLPNEYEPDNPDIIQPSELDLDLAATYCKNGRIEWLNQPN